VVYLKTLAHDTLMGLKVAGNRQQIRNTRKLFAAEWRAGKRKMRAMNGMFILKSESCRAELEISIAE
jgi:hypothetical protein